MISEKTLSVLSMNRIVAIACHNLMQKAMSLIMLSLFMLKEILTEFNFGTSVKMMQLT